MISCNSAPFFTALSCPPRPYREGQNQAPGSQLKPFTAVWSPTNRNQRSHTNDSPGPLPSILPLGIVSSVIRRLRIFFGVATCSTLVSPPPFLCPVPPPHRRGPGFKPSFFTRHMPPPPGSTPLLSASCSSRPQAHDPNRRGPGSQSPGGGGALDHPQPRRHAAPGPPPPGDPHPTQAVAPRRHPFPKSIFAFEPSFPIPRATRLCVRYIVFFPNYLFEYFETVGKGSIATVTSSLGFSDFPPPPSIARLPLPWGRSPAPSRFQPPGPTACSYSPKSLDRPRCPPPNWLVLKRGQYPFFNRLIGWDFFTRHLWP